MSFAFGSWLVVLVAFWPVDTTVFLWQRNLPTGASQTSLKLSLFIKPPLNHWKNIEMNLKQVERLFLHGLTSLWNHFPSGSIIPARQCVVACGCVLCRCHLFYLFCSWPVLYVQFEIPYPDYVCLWRGKNAPTFLKLSQRFKSQHLKKNAWLFFRVIKTIWNHFLSRARVNPSKTRHCCIWMYPLVI